MFKLLKRLPYLPLGFPWLRKRFAFEIQQRHFGDLALSIPIHPRIMAPIHEKRFLKSFQEIFVDNEYEECFAHFPIPTRWLDIGCHAGFFSLWVLNKRYVANFADTPQTLLIDGDRRTEDQINLLIRTNELSGYFKYRCAAIASSGTTIGFNAGAYMDSCASTNRNSDIIVPVICEEQILSIMPGPYDVVKLDIEGAEYDFLTSYKEILKQTQTVVLEWHDWHSGGGGKDQLVDLIQDLGFAIVHDQEMSINAEHRVGLLCCILQTTLVDADTRQ